MKIYENHKKFFLSLIAFSSTVFMLGFYLTPITTNDFWIQLNVGELIKNNFSIPKTILFAFTPETNKPFVAHEWLPSFLFSFFYDLFGYYFMIFLKFFLYSISFLLAYSLAYRISRKPLISFFITLLCLYTLNYRSFMRPEAFAYIFFLIQINLLSLYLQKNHFKYLIYYLLVNILWVNSHGSFLLSMAFPGMLAFSVVFDNFVSRSFFKRKVSLFSKSETYLAALSFACLLSSLINPLGYHLLVHSYELSQDSLLKKTIFEWKPILSGTVRMSSIFSVFLVFISFLSLILIYRFTKLRTFSLLLLSIFTVLAFQAQRHLAFLALASVWPLSIMLRDLEERSYGAFFLSCSLIATPLYLSYSSYKYGNTVRTRPGFYHSARIPQDTLTYIKDNQLKGNTLNTYSLGGQLLFHFYPQIKIGIDSRVDAYGVEYARQYRKLIYGDYRKLKSFINAYSIQNIIVNHSAYRAMGKKGSLRHLKEDGWKLTHRNSKVVILEFKG